MNVFFTGGTGRVGKAAVARLIACGHSVTVIGRTAGVTLDGARYEPCDINDFSRLIALLPGHDSIVHLAAIPNPVGRPGRELFRVNGLGTFTVYEAAAAAGIHRVVTASSINAFGYFFGDRSFPIRYLPIDEQLVGIATDAYSFSKQVVERIAEYFWERDGISGVCLRLPAVYAHERVLQRDALHGGNPRDVIVRLLDLDDEKRARAMQELHKAYDRFRRENRIDQMTWQDWGLARTRLCDLFASAELHVMHHKANMFAYIDEIDSAQAIELGLTGTYTGSHAIYVNAARNAIGLPVAELAKLYFPPVPEIRPQHPGDDCLCSIDNARELLGFEPEWVL